MNKLEKSHDGAKSWFESDDFEKNRWGNKLMNGILKKC